MDKTTFISESQIYGFFEGDLAMVKDMEHLVFIARNLPVVKSADHCLPELL
jgi:hypothetical protein